MNKYLMMLIAMFSVLIILIMVVRASYFEAVVLGLIIVFGLWFGNYCIKNHVNLQMIDKLDDKIKQMQEDDDIQ